jgi:uncharacterized membrane protein
MTTSSKKNRIIFIDLLRAFAVLQMVQGHTTDVLLSNTARDFSNPVYYLWHFMRGMTAPVFMFTAGTVFTYLFRLSNAPFKENLRVRKGLNRALILLAIGYLLRYPTPTLIDFSRVSETSWRIFMGVDVLHLIGISLLIIMFIAFIAERLKTNDYLLFGAAALFFFALYQPVYSIDWNSFLPQYIAGYFYRGTGSQFPIFPWAGYLMAGALLGSYLAKNPFVFRSSAFSVKLAAAGIIFLIITYAGDYVEASISQSNKVWKYGYSIIAYRVGFVLLLTSLVSYISLKVDSIPKIIVLLGRNTLLIYVVHLVILYGSAWNKGINHFAGKTFSGWQTFSAALLMILLMTGMVILVNKLKIKNKELVT